MELAKHCIMWVQKSKEWGQNIRRVKVQQTHDRCPLTDTCNSDINMILLKCKIFMQFINLVYINSALGNIMFSQGYVDIFPIMILIWLVRNWTPQYLILIIFFSVKVVSRITERTEWGLIPSQVYLSEFNVLMLHLWCICILKNLMIT
jgi:hypothetical protein